MFRLVRLCVLLLIAFVAGIFFERGNQKDQCETSGGQWMRVGFCAEP
ncbi:hypothetical protein [Antarctobacter jejuensis]